MLGPSFVTSLYPPREKILDFFQEWASARNWFEGLPVYEHQGTTMQRYLGFEARPGTFGIERNAHPPTSVLLALPFGRLDYSGAFLAWSLLSLATLPASIWILLRQLKLTVSLWALVPAVTLLLACNPLRQQVNQGQLNLILLFLVVTIWAAE